MGLNAWMIVILIIEALLIVSTILSATLFPDAFQWLLGASVGGVLLILAGFAAERGMLGLKFSNCPDWYKWYNSHTFIILPIVNAITILVMFFGVGIFHAATVTAICGIVATFASGLPEICIKNLKGDNFIPGTTSVITAISAFCIASYWQNDTITWICTLVAAAVFVGFSLYEQFVYDRIGEEWYFPFIYLPSYFFMAMSLTALSIEEQICYFALSIACVFLATAINSRILDEYSTSNMAEEFYEKSSYVIAIVGNILGVILMFNAGMEDTENAYMLALIVIFGVLVSSIVTAFGDEGDAISALSIIVCGLIFLYTAHLTADYFVEDGIRMAAGIIFAAAYIYAGHRVIGFSNADFMESEVFSFDLYMDGGKFIVIIGAIMQLILTIVTYVNPAWQWCSPFCIIGIGIVSGGLIWRDEESELPVKLGGLLSTIAIAAINLGWIGAYF